MYVQHRQIFKTFPVYGWFNYGYEGLWIPQNIMLHGQYLQFDLPAFLLKMQILLPQSDLMRQQSLAEWSKEETHSKGLFQTQRWVKKGSTNHVDGPVFHSLRSSHRENPSESLVGQPCCPNLSQQGQQLQCMLHFYLPTMKASPGKHF